MLLRLTADQRNLYIHAYPNYQALFTNLIAAFCSLFGSRVIVVQEKSQKVLGGNLSVPKVVCKYKITVFQPPRWCDFIIMAMVTTNHNTNAR